MYLAPLLRKRRISKRNIFKRSHATVRKLKIHADRILRRLGPICRLDAHRLNLLNRRTADIAHEIDEVASLADHASTTDFRVLKPNVLRDRPRVDAVVHHERKRPLRKILLQQLSMRAKPSVEPNHYPAKVVVQPQIFTHLLKSFFR